MKRKIIKYTKFIVSMVLILGLVAPSYASLSASDGSAFVTKAEFDSALADFNSRLTTFEAGINSKIDSQVTSYLDRNGIWNGKAQDLNESFGWFAPITHKDIFGMTARWPYTYEFQYKGETRKYVAKSIPDFADADDARTTTRAALTDADYGREVVFYYADYNIVKSLSKSGLCCLQISFDPLMSYKSAANPDNRRTAILCGSLKAGSTYVCSHDGSGVQEASKSYVYAGDWSGNENALGTFKWADKITIETVAGYTVVCNSGVAILYFFVRKGDSLNIRFKHAAIPTLIRTLGAMAIPTNVNGTTKYLCSMFINLPYDNSSNFDYSLAGSIYNVDNCVVY